MANYPISLQIFAFGVATGNWIRIKANVKKLKNAFYL
jgi:hypothetical protein